MAEYTVAYADGGGPVSAAIQPIRGRERLAQVTLYLAQKAEADGPLDIAFTPMNGGWGLVIKQHGAVHSCFQVSGSNGRMQRIYVVRNPEKLARLG